MPKKESTKSPAKNSHGEERMISHTPFAEINGLLLEQAYDGRSSYYLLFNPDKPDDTTRVDQLRHNDRIYRPIESDETGKTVLLPSKALEYESEDRLIHEIKAFLNYWHEPPDPLSRVLDIFYVFLTYVKDLIPQLPYRRYLAPWGRGKSAWLETVGWICYRGMIMAGSDTDKSVVRKLNNWKGTALIDEADFGRSDFYAFITKILNIGYDRKTGFYQRADDNEPTKTLSYNVYGPKLLATRAKYKDMALESRCLTTVGRQNVNLIPLFRMGKFEQQALKLRNKLILWRFRNYHRIKELAVELEDPRIVDKVYDGANSISSRVKQVIMPLWLIGGDSMKDTLTKLATTFDVRLKIEDPDYLLELQAREGIRRILENGEGVNMVNMLNILYGTPDRKEAFYEIGLSKISRAILELRGIKDDKIEVRSVTSVSKHLRRVFEANLGFNIRIGKARKRVVLIPASWVQVDLESPKDLMDFVREGEDSYNNVQDVHHVHPEMSQEEKLRLVLSHIPSDIMISADGIFSKVVRKVGAREIELILKELKERNFIHEPRRGLFQRVK